MSTKSDPGFEFRFQVNPDMDQDRDQNVVDSLPCHRQAFRHVL